MSFVFTEAKRALAAGELDLNLDDMRFALLMTNTTITAAGEEDETLLTGLVLDEMDGAGYVRKALANETVTAVAASNAGMFDADDVTWTALGAGTRAIKGVLLYKHVGADSANVPVAWYDDAPFPLAANGSDFTVRVNANGLMRLT